MAVLRLDEIRHGTPEHPQLYYHNIAGVLILGDHDISRRPLAGYFPMSDTSALAIQSTVDGNLTVAA